MNFTKVDRKYQRIINEIEYALNTLKEPKLIFKFIVSWVLNHPIENYKEIFSYPLHEAYKRDAEGFIENYLFLIIHNKGKVRFYANNITDFIQVTENNKEIWRKYLCKFDKDQIVKFINSIFSDFFKPEERMKLVLILLYKKDDDIFKYILQHFVWLVHDYGGMVKETIESLLDNQNSLEKKFIASFKNCYEKIIYFWERKNKIKEFDPYNCQAASASKFDKLFYKKQSEDLRKSVAEHSVFMQLCTKITISRGRKFKIGANDQYSEMNELKTSCTIPRTYFIFPELYNYKRIQRLTDDWEGES
jgi:F0F1-type ATP synthase delta subunit